jgi:hypothetical protein
LTRSHNNLRSEDIQSASLEDLEDLRLGPDVHSVEGSSLVPQLELPLRSVYFPMGFPLEVFSNSATVMAAAADSWKQFRPKFADAPLKLRIQVEGDTKNSSLPPRPVCSLQWNILLHVADAQNFIVCDLKDGRAFGSITQSVAHSPHYFRYYFLEAAALSMVTGLRAAPVHAACVSPFGSGMLLCGESGAGKSSLAYAGARAGWTYTCDDASYLPLNRYDRLVIGNHHQIRFRSRGIHLFPELAERSITPRAAGKPSIEVSTTQLPDLITSDSAMIEYIIFLNRHHPGEDALVPISKSSALPWFKKWCLIASAQSRAEQHAALEHLLDVPIYELRYRNLEWAIVRLEQLVTTGG